MALAAAENKSVWIVTCGEYSDRYVVGYCTSEEEAIRYCAAKNSADYGFMDVYRIEECKCLDHSIIGNIDAGMSSEVHFASDGFVLFIEKKIRARHAPIVNAHRGAYGVIVWQKEYDKEKAIKCARDLLYEYLAEQEGIHA